MLIKKIISSFRYALNGIYKAASEELNLQIELVATVFVIVISYLDNFTTLEWVITLVCIGSVLSLELMNSAIENVVDLITLEENELAKKAKDMAAGSVLVAAMISAIIWIIILVSHH